MTSDEDPLVLDNRILAVRLSLAQAWIKVLLQAYDALLHYGINYRTLKEWKDWGAQLAPNLDNHGTLEDGRAKIMNYIERLGNGITAAVRRKHMRPV
jgi:hypothetical protein